jgi:hypothetical protein
MLQTTLLADEAHSQDQEGHVTQLLPVHHINFEKQLQAQMHDFGDNQQEA